MLGSARSIGLVTVSTHRILVSHETLMISLNLTQVLFSVLFEHGMLDQVTRSKNYSETFANHSNHHSIQHAMMETLADTCSIADRYR